MSSTLLHAIAREVLLREVREFVTTTIETSDGSQLTGPEIVREIRNALWMPQGVEAHARILLEASNIDPEREGSGEERTQREIETGTGMWKKGFTSSLRRLTEELELLDMHMEEFVRSNYATLVGEKSGAVQLRSQHDAEAMRRQGKAVAYPLIEAALRSSMRSTSDTPAGRAAHKGGRYAPETRPGYNAMRRDTDLVDAMIEDFLEIILQPEDAPERVDFDKARERFEDIVVNLLGDRDDPQTDEEWDKFSQELEMEFDRERASARAKLLQSERDRGAAFPDVVSHEVVTKITDVLGLFMGHIVRPKGGAKRVPIEEYGYAFAAILSKACGIDYDYELPSSLKVMPIRPLLPESVDNGIVDFLDAVHEEIERQVSQLPMLKMVTKNILNPSAEFYDRSGNPRLPFTYDSPHPSYA